MKSRGLQSSIQITLAAKPHSARHSYFPERSKEEKKTQHVDIF